MSDNKLVYSYMSEEYPVQGSGLNAALPIHHVGWKIGKRVFDIAIALIMLVTIAPWLFLLVSVVIWLDTNGSPFFVQKRVGKDRKLFFCIKFRTMYKNDQAHRLQVEENDTRITAVGQFLRKYHIDELPQIMNVLLGQMSIVGPRPHMVRHDLECRSMVNDYHLRGQIKPGMTGLAQVRGFHGTIISKEDLTLRVKSDLEYIRNWSLFLDIDIFIRTVFQNLFKLDRS